MLKSIKQQYIDLREGNMTQANFMRNLRMTLPQYITNLSSFEDSVKILKNKGILTEMLDPDAAEEIALAAGSYEAAVDKLEDMGLSPQAANDIANKLYSEAESLNEAKDEKGKWTNANGKAMYDQFKEVDNLNGHEVTQGIDWEMQCNPELTKNEATKIVIKKLKKNPLYYTSWDMSGVEGYEPEYIGGKSTNPEAHQMQYLEKNMGNVVDKKMGMQPVKDVEKAKKDSDKGGETNKMEKGVSLMSLIAKSTRGVQKMDATGEKMKKIAVKEVKLNNFPGEEPNEAVKLAMQFIESNPLLKQHSDEFTIQNGKDDAILKYNYWEAIPDDVFNKLELQFEVEEDIEEHDDKAPTIAYFLKPKHKMSTTNLGQYDLNKLKEVIKKIAENMDGMEPMSRTGLDNE